MSGMMRNICAGFLGSEGNLNERTTEGVKPTDFHSNAPISGPPR